LPIAVFEGDPFATKPPPLAQVVGEHEAVVPRRVAVPPICLKVRYVYQ